MRHVTCLYFNFFSKIIIKCFKNSISLSGPNRFSVHPSYLFSLAKQPVYCYHVWLKNHFFCHEVGFRMLFKKYSILCGTGLSELGVQGGQFLPPLLVGIEFIKRPWIIACPFRFSHFPTAMNSFLSHIMTCFFHQR